MIRWDLEIDNPIPDIGDVIEVYSDNNSKEPEYTVKAVKYRGCEYCCLNNNGCYQGANLPCRYNTDIMFKSISKESE